MTVQEMFDRLILPRLRVTPQPIALPVIEAVNLTVEYIAARLADRKSDLVKGLDNLDVLAEEVTAQLPADFGGLNVHPSIGTTPLERLNPAERSLYSVSPGTPSKYEQVGSLLYLYPIPMSDVTVDIDYLVRPAAIDAMVDDIPWNGLFDHLIADVALKFSVGGHAAAVDPGVSAEIENGLDQVLFPRSAPLPTRRAVRTF